MLYLRSTAMTQNPETIDEPGPPAFARQLKRQTLRSIVWTMGQVAGDQLFSFAVFVMLARLLDKPAIGTFAIAFVFMDIGRNFATAGVSQRVARERICPAATSTRSSGPTFSSRRLIPC